MTFHELIYKLIGTAGTVLELPLDGQVSVAEAAKNALPELTWREFDEKDLKVDHQENHLFLADLRNARKTLQLANVQQLLERSGTCVLLLPADDEKRVVDLLKETDQRELHPESLAPVSIGENEIVAIVFRRTNTGSRIDDRTRRALTELALLRYTRERERNLVSHARQLQEERDKLRELSEQQAHWKLQAENLELTVMRHQDRLEELSRELRERETKYAHIERQLSRRQAQLEAQQRRATSLRRSFSYRFGNLFALAARSPRDLALLPFRAVRMIAGAGVAFMQRRKQQRIDTKVVHAPSPGPRDPVPELASPRENEQLRNMLNIDEQSSRSEMATALVGHTFTQRLLNANGDIAVLHPNTWRSQLERLNTRSIIVDAYRGLAHSPWQYTLEGASLGYPGHLVDLLDYCRSKSLASILMLTGNVHEYESLFDVAPLFTHIIAPMHTDLAPVISSLTGRTKILRSSWPVANTASTQELGLRKRQSAGHLVIRDGAVFFNEKSSSELQLVASAFAPLEPQKAFGLPLLLDTRTEIDLRVFELLSKGAIPVGPEEHLLPYLEHYQFVATSSAAETIWNVSLDDTLCLGAARSNVLAAATHDTISRTLAEVAIIGGIPETSFHLSTRLAAIVILKEEKEILLVLNSLERQHTLPARLMFIADFDVNPAGIKTLVEKQLDPAIETKVIVGRGDWQDLAQTLDSMPNGTWTCIVDARCHYGAAYFSRAAALAGSGLATTYGLFTGNTDPVDRASLIIERNAGLRLGKNLSGSTNNLADSVPRSFVPDCVSAGADFHRPDHAKSL